MPSNHHYGVVALFNYDDKKTKDTGHTCECYVNNAKLNFVFHKQETTDFYEKYIKISYFKTNEKA